MRLPHCHSRVFRKRTTSAADWSPEPRSAALILTTEGVKAPESYGRTWGNRALKGPGEPSRENMLEP